MAWKENQYLLTLYRVLIIANDPVTFSTSVCDFMPLAAAEKPFCVIVVDVILRVQQQFIADKWPSFPSCSLLLPQIKVESKVHEMHVQITFWHKAYLFSLAVMCQDFTFPWVCRCALWNSTLLATAFHFTLDGKNINSMQSQPDFEVVSNVWQWLI